MMKNRAQLKKRSYEEKENLILLLPVYLVVFSAFFDTHAQMPVLAPFAQSLTATPFWIGLIIGTYSLFNIFGNFISGTKIDFSGWQKPLFLGLVGVSVTLLLYPQAQNPLQLAMIRAGHGFLGGFLVPSALACLTGSYEKSYLREKRIALFGATIGLAAVTGPLASGIIAARYSFALVYYCLAALMIFAALVALLFLSKKAVCSPPDRQKGLYRQIAAKPIMQSAFLFALGTMGSTGTLASFLPTRTALVGLDHAQTGQLFATFAFTAIIVQMLWPDQIKSLLRGNLNGSSLGLILLSAALVMAALTDLHSGLFLALALFGIGFGLSFQGMIGLIIEGSEPAWQGRAIGFFFAVYSLGVALVPPLSGLIWQSLPFIFPFYSAAAVALTMMIAGRCKAQLQSEPKITP